MSNPVHDAAELAAYLANTRCKRLPHLAVPVDKDPIIVRSSEEIVPLTCEALAIDVDRGIDADGVADALDRLALTHGAPHYVRFDNGPEFVAHAVSDWCRFNGADSLFIDPGSPWQNAWIEPFNGRLRDELLNSWRFDSLLEARVISKTGAATTTPTHPTPPTANSPQPSSLYSGPRPTNPKSHSDWTTNRVPLTLAAGMAAWLVLCVLEAQLLAC